MLHLGDITKIDGTKVPAVEVIIGGSPCQNLSVAGNRKGLAGEQSQLFLEQIRIIKEMREKSARENGAVNAKPRYMVWENVPGAFSSNKGRDFKTVLEETIGVVTEVKPDIPIPKEGWHYSGCIMGEEFSLAWRVFDAQFWGVPQRRRRIALVADFGGESAPEILFERKGLSGDFEPGGTPGEETAGGTRAGTDCAISFQERAGKPGGGKGILIQNERTGALSTLNNQSVFCAGFSYGQSAKASSVGYQEERSPTLRSGEGGNQKPCVYDARGNGERQGIERDAVVQTYAIQRNDEYKESDLAHTQAARDYKSATDLVVSAVDCRNMNESTDSACTKGNNNAGTRNQILCLLQETYGEEKVLKWGIAILERLQQADILQQGVYESRISGEAEKWNELDDCALPRTELVTGWMLRDLWKQQKCGRSPQGWESAEQQSGQFAESLPKLSQQNSQACKDLFDMWQKGEGLWLLREALSEIQKIWKSLNGQRQSVYGHSIVRRLTPLEAERLQGYPDGWTDIGDYTDTKGKKRKTSDSARYKALGNSIALPNWLYVLSRLSHFCTDDLSMASLFDGIGGFPLIWEAINGAGTCLWASEIDEFPMAVTRYHFNYD